MSQESEKVWKDARRIVIKVGSSLVTNDGHGVNRKAIQKWADQIAELQKLGKEVILVSSGAIAEGMARLGWTKRPKKIHEQQAAAAIGQMGIVEAYEKAFETHGIKTAQLLLTHEDLADRERYLNARQTLVTLLSLKVVPVINENDTVVTSEIKVGDNDTLGALVTNLVEADVLVILTDQIGLFSCDPRQNPEAKLITEGRAGDHKYETMAGGAGSSIGKGGMLTKVLAAKRASRSGASTVIASGHVDKVLIKLVQGASIGTLLYTVDRPISARRQWMCDHLQLKGELVIDDGAKQAVFLGKSLLSVGVKKVGGVFFRGEVVRCLDENGEEVCRGLINYSSEDAKKISGLHSDEIVEALGYIEQRELIHQDNMVVTGRLK